jgi:hypothetical protein
MWFENLKPAVRKRWLMIIAGAMWTGVGVLLIVIAWSWILRMPVSNEIMVSGIGAAIGLVIYRFGFSRIALKNITRIHSSPDVACVFSFQAWKSYVIIVVMMAMGIMLRHSAIPRYELAVLYTAIGCGLFFSSFLYYSAFGKSGE